MKKFIFISVIAAIYLSSCASSQKTIVPRASNSINTASLDVLNLERKDYEILNTVTAEASVVFRQHSNGYELTIPDDDFSYKCSIGKGGLNYKYTGIFKAGNLSGTAYPSTTLINAETASKELALYRIINISKQEGADAVIAPTITMNIEQISKKEIVYKTTVTAKLVKLKTNN